MARPHAGDARPVARSLPDGRQPQQHDGQQGTQQRRGAFAITGPPQGIGAHEMSARHARPRRQRWSWRLQHLRQG